MAPCSRRRAIQAMAALAALPGGAHAASHRASGTLQPGFNLVAWGHSPWPFEKLAAALDRLAAFGTRRVTLVTFRYVDPDTGAISSHSGSALPDAPDMRVLAQVLRHARTLGLVTSLNALVEIGSPAGIGNRWRGELAFAGTASLQRFFADYRDYQLAMAGMARATGVSRFYVGSELSALATDPAQTRRWVELIDAIRSGEPGGPLALGYSANFTEYPDVGFWSSLDQIGVSAYFPLATPEQAQGPRRPSMRTLRASWSDVLQRLSAFGRAQGKPVAISEWGLVPLDSCTAMPWDVAPSTLADPEERRRGYRAVVESLTHEAAALASFDLWHWYVGAESGPFAVRAGGPVADIIGG